jgi:hypothetical protein
MALKGNLRDFSFTQLLNLINLAKKTGTLIIESSNTAAQVSFREGRLAYAQLGRDDNRLTSILFRANKLTANQQKVINERSGNISDKELGLLLVNANYLSQQDILNSLQAYLIEIVSQLFTWVDGVFRFENGLLPPEDKITLRISLENLIMEGVRRTRESEQLQDEIPSLEMALKFNDRPGSNIRSLSLSKEEWKVVSYINPKNSIKQIGQATRLNDLQIRRIVFGLLQAGLVEIVRPQGETVSTSTAIPGLPKASKEEQKSLITRLIERILSI